MRGRDNKKNISTSLLDLLVNAETVPGFDALCESVRRDVENLLNTHVPFMRLPEELRELKHSLLSYGIPDFTTHAFSSEANMNKLCDLVCEKIGRFEPRFKELKVSIIDNELSADKHISFRISGVIYAEPVPEAITLDSVLNNHSGRFSVNYDG